MVELISDIVGRGAAFRAAGAVADRVVLVGAVVIGGAGVVGTGELSCGVVASVIAGGVTSQLIEELDKTLTVFHSLLKTAQEFSLAPFLFMVVVAQPR